MIKYETIQNEYHVCDNCGKVIEIGYDDNVITTSDGETELCNDCLELEANYCNYCKEYHLTSDFLSIDIDGEDVEICCFKKDSVLEDLEASIAQIKFYFY